MIITALRDSDERRHSGERHQLVGRTIYYSFTQNRRRHQRRGDERKHYISDQQELWALFTALAVSP